jgi:hypothetical protein
MLPYFRVKGQVNCGGRSVAGSDETVVLVQMLGPESFPLSHTVCSRSYSTYAVLNEKEKVAVMVRERERHLHNVYL